LGYEQSMSALRWLYFFWKELRWLYVIALSLRWFWACQDWRELYNLDPIWLSKWFFSLLLFCCDWSSPYNCSSWSAYSISKFLVFFKVLWNLLTFLSKMSHRTCLGIIFGLSLALVVNGSRKEKFASGLLQQFLAYLKATQFHLWFLLVVSAWFGIQLALVSNLINLCNSSFLSSFLSSKHQGYKETMKVLTD